MPPKKIKREELPEESYFTFDDGMPQGYSIPFVTFENNAFAVNDEAVAKLQTLQSPLAVVVVAGLYRTGKSFLLNRVILGKQNAFTVGPTTRACTKGIWLWSEPLTTVGRDGKEVKVIVLDTEGIGAPTADATHDTRIFALGLLLSTFFIYNSVGSIDEQALSNMSLVTNLSKQLRSNNEADLSDYPAFLWVVRDFALQLQNQDGHAIGSSEYLEDALKDVDPSHPTAANKNRIRSCLRSFFPVRDCFTMVRPCTMESQLQTLDKLPNKSLRPEFVAQAVELRQRVFTDAAARPFRVNGVELNGSMLASMCAQYVNAMNQGQVPVIQDAWSYVCDAQRLKKEEACLSACMTAFTKHASAAKTVTELKMCMLEVVDGMLMEYQDLCVKLYPHDNHAVLVEALDKRIQPLMQSQLVQFQTKYHALVTEAVFAAHGELESRLLRQEFKDASQFQVAVQDAYTRYASTYGGDGDEHQQNMLDAVWYSKTEALLWRAMFNFYGSREQELASTRAEVERLRAQVEAATRRYAEREREWAAEREQHVESLTAAHKFVVSQLEEQLREAAAKVGVAEARSSTLADELLAATNSAGAQVAALQQELDSERLRADGAADEIAMLRDELEDLAADNAEVQEQARQLSEACLERDRLRAEVVTVRRELAEERRTCQEVEEALRKESKDIQAAALQSLSLLKESRRVEQQQLRSARDAAAAKCTSLEAALSAVQDELATVKRQQVEALEAAEGTVARLRQQLDDNEARLVQVQRESVARQQEVERAVREKDRAADAAVQSAKDERMRLEQQYVKRTQELETKLALAERSEAERRRQLELAEERWKRKRARTDDDGENKSLELVKKEAELTWLRQHKVELDNQVVELRKALDEVQQQKRQLERTRDAEMTRLTFEYEAKLASRDFGGH